jgi:lipopolysaccharide transport system ATP-binding protein
VSNNPTVKVSHVGKRYRLGRLEPYRTLRDKIMNIARGVSDRGQKEQIWALKDVNFEVKQGEVLGIIGRNGAGKSTLLKLLSRITTPDTGMIELEGRVGALLEVGTGFHPELSGRENIYMNGAILGMTRRDIDRKFDEIVAFSGVEPFLDTPVKRYSSGMRVRLGFAVAAHLEPEILVIDEVLAVGDAEFQRKCLGRMNQVAGEGRTVLFVSHQMEAIQSLCTRAVWLEEGELVSDGDANDVVSKYLAKVLSIGSTQSLADRKDRAGEGTCRVLSIAIHDGAGMPAKTGGAAEFILDLGGLLSDGDVPQLDVRIGIRDRSERVITMLGNAGAGQPIEASKTGAQVVCRIPRMPLVPGTYLVDIAVRVRGVLEDKVWRAASFDVLSGNFSECGRNEHAGFFHVEQAWKSRQSIVNELERW